MSKDRWPVGLGALRVREVPGSTPGLAQLFIHTNTFFFFFLQLVTVTKEMCGLRGAAKTDFDSSVSRFTQQVTYISKLVGKTNDALNSMAITGHLLVVTSPENFQSGKLTVSELHFFSLNSLLLTYLIVPLKGGVILLRLKECVWCSFVHDSLRLPGTRQGCLRGEM